MYNINVFSVALFSLFYRCWRVNVTGGSEPAPVQHRCVLRSPVLSVLQVLENEGLAEVHPWNLHLYGMDLFYVAQFSAIQDCLYRHLWSSKYLLFGDVDELFVPRKRPTLMPLLQTVFDKVTLHHMCVCVRVILLFFFFFFLL